VIDGTALVVVGVVLNLALYLGLHTLFGMVTEITVLGMVIPVPHLTTLDVFAFLLAAVMFIISTHVERLIFELKGLGG
jgi:hypothetical protein